MLRPGHGSFLGIFELDLSWAMWLGAWFKISCWTPTQKSKRAGGWKIEWAGARGMIWGFPWEFSVRPEVGKLEGFCLELEGAVLDFLDGPIPA